jgi:hypothetical protein
VEETGMKFQDNARSTGGSLEGVQVEVILKADRFPTQGDPEMSETLAPTRHVGKLPDWV